jgi:hypothetical protein
MKAYIKTLCKESREEALNSLTMDTLKGLARLAGLKQTGSKQALKCRLAESADIVIHAEARIGLKSPADKGLVSGENPSIQHFKEQSAWIEQVEIVSEVPLKSGGRIARNV